MQNALVPADKSEEQQPATLADWIENNHRPPPRQVSVPDERIDEFLQQLSKLTHKYNICLVASPDGTVRMMVFESVKHPTAIYYTDGHTDDVFFGELIKLQERQQK